MDYEKNILILFNTLTIILLILILITIFSNKDENDITTLSKTQTSSILMACYMSIGMMLLSGDNGFSIIINYLFSSIYDMIN